MLTISCYLLLYIVKITIYRDIPWIYEYYINYSYYYFSINKNSYSPYFFKMNCFLLTIPKYERTIFTICISII